MKKSLALAQLDVAITEAERLIPTCTSDALDTWQTKTKVAIRRIFGAGSEPETEFAQVSFGPPIYTASMTEADFAEWRQIGVKGALTRLRAWREEVELYGPPRTASTLGGSGDLVDFQRISLRDLLTGLWRLSLTSVAALVSLVIAIFALGTKCGESQIATRTNATADSLSEVIRDIRTPARKVETAVPLNVSSTPELIRNPVSPRKSAIVK